MKTRFVLASCAFSFQIRSASLLLMSTTLFFSRIVETFIENRSGFSTGREERAFAMVNRSRMTVEKVWKYARVLTSGAAGTFPRKTAPPCGNYFPRENTESRLLIAPNFVI